MSQPPTSPALRRRRSLSLPSWRTSVTLLGAGTLLALAWRPPLSWWPRLLLLGCGLVLASRAIWPPGGPQLIGPLWTFDLARLARRGRTTLLRCTYGLLLLAWLCYAFVELVLPLHGRIDRLFEPGLSLPIQEWPRLAERFVARLMALQGAAVLVLTPAYLAGAVAEEKERKTLALLFTTDLSNREIVLGKLCGRLLHLGCLLLIALPILSLTRLWGGVDETVLLAAFAVTALTLVSVGSVSILCSVMAPNVLMATLSSYAAVFLLWVCCLAFTSCSPITFLQELNERIETEQKAWLDALNSTRPIGGPFLPPGPPPFPAPDPTVIVVQMLGTYALVHGVIFLVCSSLAIANLRRTDGLPQPVAPALRLARGQVTGGWDPLEVQPVYMRVEPRIWRERPPPWCDAPLLWKEVCFGVHPILGPLVPPWLAQHWRRLVLLLLLSPLPYLCFHWLVPQMMTDQSQALNLFSRALVVFCAFVACVGVGLRSAGSISREREQQTLEGLLTLPVERTEILRAKWLGSILHWRAWSYALAGNCLFGLFTGGLHPWAVLLLAAACTAQFAFLASLGLWLSLASRTTLWANMAMALVLLLLFGGSWVGVIDSPPRGVELIDWGETFVETGLNPVRGWWFLAFSWTELAEVVASGEAAFWRRLGGALAGIAVFVIAAWVFWLLACQRFQREPRRGGR